MLDASPPVLAIQVSARTASLDVRAGAAVDVLDDLAGLPWLCRSPDGAPTGHEFPRTVVHGTPAPPAWRSVGSPADGFMDGSVHASYLHLHRAGRPSIASRLVAAAS